MPDSHEGSLHRGWGKPETMALKRGLAGNHKVPIRFNSEPGGIDSTTKYANDVALCHSTSGTENFFTFLTICFSFWISRSFWPKMNSSCLVYLGLAIRLSCFLLIDSHALEAEIFHQLPRNHYRQNSRRPSYGTNCTKKFKRLSFCIKGNRRF